MKRILKFSILLLLLIPILLCCEKENAPPSCGITSPQNGSEYEVGEVITISVEAEDEDGSISEVLFYIDDTRVSAVSKFPFNYQWNTRSVEEGVRKIKVTAKDYYGNFSQDSITIELVPTNFELRINDISEITDISAKVHYIIEEKKFIDPYRCGLCWSIDSLPTINDDYVLGPSTYGSFELEIGQTWQKIIETEEINTSENRLRSATEYFVRPFVITNSETYYGDQYSFKTPNLGFLRVEFPDGFDDISFINSKEIFGIASSSDNIYMSEDGGANWIQVNYEQTQASEGHDFFTFISEKVGFMNRSNTIIKTTDGGNSWREVNCNFPDYFYDFYFSKGLYFCSNDFGYSLARTTFPAWNSRAVVVTYDEGENWSFLNTPSELSHIVNVTFYSKDIGIIYGSVGNTLRLFQTKNGGNSWIDISYLLNNVLLIRRIYNFSPSHSALVLLEYDSENYTILRTEDAWDNFELIQLEDLHSHIFQFGFIDYNTMLISIDGCLFIHDLETSEIKNYMGYYTGLSMNNLIIKKFNEFELALYYTHPSYYSFLYTKNGGNLDYNTN